MDNQNFTEMLVSLLTGRVVETREDGVLLVKDQQGRTCIAAKEMEE